MTDIKQAPGIMYQGEIDNISKALHELVDIQNTFRSYEKLANDWFRFNPHQFHKCVIKIQTVIDYGRDLQKEE